MKLAPCLGPLVASLLIAGPAFAQPQPPATDPAPPSEPPPAPEDDEDDTESGYLGIILDPMGQPIAGAKVVVPSLGVEGVTSDVGEVMLDVPPGTYRVRVTAKGFEALEQEAIFDESAAMMGLELLLQYEVGEVVVTGNKEEQIDEKAPVRTQVLSRERLERREAATLADALQGTTGVRVENGCQNCGLTELRLNGLEGRYTQILIDGRPVFSSLAGVYGLEQIPKEMIERIEIVKGGGSALYGGNAIGGVVNVITRRPTRDFGSLAFRYDAIDMDATSLQLNAVGGLINDDKDLSLHVFGGATTREPWDANGDGFSEIGKIRSVVTGGESYWDLFDGGRLAVKFHVLRERRRGGNAFDLPEHDSAVSEATHTTRYGGELHWSHILSDAWKLEAGYGFAYTERNSYYGGGGDVVLPSLPENAADWTQAEWDAFRDAYDAKVASLGAYGRTRNPLHTGDILLHSAFQAAGEMIVTGGVQYRHERLEDMFPAYRQRSIDESYTNVAGVLEHDWLFASWGESVIGVRVDKHSKLDDPVVSPRATLKLDPKEWLQLRTAFSTGFRAPQIFDEDLHVTIIGGEGQIISNDPELEPERSTSVAQQVETTFEPTDGWRIKTGVNGFLTSISDAFVFAEADTDPTDQTLEFLRTNRGRTVVVGAEVDGSVEYAGVWGLSTGFTFERARNAEADADFGTKDIMRTPKWYGHVETWAEPAAGLRVQTLLDLTGPMKVPHYEGYIDENRLEESEVFYDWSANVSYRLDIGSDRYVAPVVGMKNILNSYQEDLDRGPDRDAGYFYGPRLPRTAFLGLKGGI